MTAKYICETKKGRNEKIRAYQLGAQKDSSEMITLIYYRNGDQ